MSTKKVYITRQIPMGGVQKLREKSYELVFWDNAATAVKPEELKKNIKGADALYCLLTDRIDASVLDAAGAQLKVVSTMSVGYDHIDVDECKKRKIQVSNTPDVSTGSVAEMTVALLLSVARRIPEGMDAVKNGEWGEWQPLWLCGMGLEDSTVGIVGLGRIGFAVAQRLKPHGIGKFLYYDGFENPRASELPAEKVSMDTILEKSDFIIACCALTPETKEVFNRKTFKRMKKNVIFINTSRGGVVQHDDLYTALRDGDIRAAGIDVCVPEPLPPEHPLLTLKNCIVLPHMSSACESVRQKMAIMAANNVIAALEGKQIPNLIPEMK